VREARPTRWGRDCFVRHGVEAQFTHALGHGIGLETHEAPALSPAVELPLEPGMVSPWSPSLLPRNGAGIPAGRHTVVVPLRRGVACWVIGWNLISTQERNGRTHVYFL